MNGLFQADGWCRNFHPVARSPFLISSPHPCQEPHAPQHLASTDVLELVSKLENGDLDLDRLVIFGYSVTFSVMHELKQNLKSLRSGRRVSVIERF
ncbi:hypothetical protein [Kocuria rhizophila]|uniref:hypothetical protein n=1 Tax=Kocuria rhizophila TaxID=72000 RepID=UPI00128FC716|nr:hypothetical protein [Kocuria rhizophila]